VSNSLPGQTVKLCRISLLIEHISIHLRQNSVGINKWTSKQNVFSSELIQNQTICSFPFCFELVLEICYIIDRLCDLVVRLPSCRPRGPEFDSRRCQIFWVVVGLRRGPLSLCEEKWEATWKKISGSGLENWDWRPWEIRPTDHATLFYLQNFALKFSKCRSLSRYSSLAG
jgi:hypothetical protein